METEKESGRIGQPEKTEMSTSEKAMATQINKFILLRKINKNIYIYIYIYIYVRFNYYYYYYY